MHDEDEYVLVPFDGCSDTDRIIQAINELGAQVSDLTDALAGAVSRIDEDFAHMADLVTQALAADASDKTEIERLTAALDEATVQHAAVIAGLNAINPDPNFPVVPAPAPTPAVGLTPPADPAPITGTADVTTAPPVVSDGAPADPAPVPSN